MSRREKNLKKAQRKAKHLEEREAKVQEQLESFKKILRSDPEYHGVEACFDFTDGETGEKFTRCFIV